MTHTHPRPSRSSRFTAALRGLWAAHLELTERQLLRERPWEEQYLHWARTDEGWVLHGELIPPGRGRRSTTRDGRCRLATPPGSRRAG